MARLLYLDFNFPYLLKDANYPVGGATIEWRSWVEGFLKDGHEVGILTWKGAKNYVSRKTKINLIETYKREGGIPKIKILYKVYPTLLKEVKRYKPD